MDCPKCGFVRPAGRVTCDCGYNFEQVEMGKPGAVQTPLKGLGGWLILFGFGLILYPIICIIGFAKFQSFLSHGVWTAMNTPGSEIYDPHWPPFVFLKFLEFGLCFVFPILLIPLFFKQKRAFPKLAILFLVSKLAIVFVAFLLVGQIPMAKVLAKASMINFLGNLLGVFIWVRYFMVSKRAKATFIE